MTVTHITYRRAHAEDLPAILAMLGAANLDTERVVPEDTLLAVADGAIVGINRVKRYADGALELSGAVVRPEWRRRGINRRLTETLRDECDGPLYLITESGNAAYVGRMGFLPVVDGASLPASIRAKLARCSASPAIRDARVFRWERLPNGD